MSSDAQLGPLTELAEQFEAASLAYVEAFGLRRDPDWFILKLQEEVGELTQAWTRLTGRGRRGERSGQELRDQLADEVADVLGHILLLARYCSIDLPPAVQRKWRFDMSESLGDSTN